MDLLVIIVNYKTADHVKKNLEVLVPELRSMGADAKCWVVDNNSPDNSVEVIENIIKDNNYNDIVKLIAHPLNAGFGAGNNVAISLAMETDSPPDHFYLLNPDAIAASGSVAKMHNHLKQNPHVGVVGGPIYNTDGSYNCGAFRFPSYLSTIEESLTIGPISKLLHNSQMAISPLPTQTANVDWVSGASMMLSKFAIEKAGMFDESFFLYFEEVDLCRRIKDNGFNINYIPDAGVIHLGGAATGVQQTNNRFPKYWHQSRRHYYSKTFGPIGLFMHNIITLTFGPVGLLYKKMRSRTDIKPHYLRDIFKYNFFRN